MARKQATKATITTTRAGSASTNRGRNKVGHELRATATSAEPEEVVRKAHDVRFDLTSNIAYHAIREQFFARLNRLLTGVQVLLGTSAVATMVGDMPGSAVWLVAISAFAGVLLLVIDPAGAARDHRAFRTRLHSVMAGLEEVEDTHESLRKARASMQRIAGEAPPAFRAVSAIAYNTAINAIYPEEIAAQHRYRVSFHRRLVANWLPMRAMIFKKERQSVSEAGDTASAVAE